MKAFINTNHGLIFVLLLLICAAGMESKMADDFDQQVGDKAADFFKQEFGQKPEPEDNEPSQE